MHTFRYIQVVLDVRFQGRVQPALTCRIPRGGLLLQAVQSCPKDSDFKHALKTFWHV